MIFFMGKQARDEHRTCLGGHLLKQTNQPIWQDRFRRYLANDLAISRAYCKLLRASWKSDLRRSASSQAAPALS